MICFSGIFPKKSSLVVPSRFTLIVVGGVELLALHIAAASSGPNCFFHLLSNHSGWENEGSSFGMFFSTLRTRFLKDMAGELIYFSGNELTAYNNSLVDYILYLEDLEEQGEAVTQESIDGVTNEYLENFESAEEKSAFKKFLKIALPVDVQEAE